MPEIAYDWELDVERGPNWLLVKVGMPPSEPCEAPPLADTLRLLMEEHFTNRLVLELDQIDHLSSELVGQLVTLDKWTRAHQGVLRLCGLTPQNTEMLRRLCRGCLFPPYRDRLEAVLGSQCPSYPG